MKLTISLAVAYLLLILIVLVVKTVEDPIITWNSTIMAESKEKNEKNLEEFATFINNHY